MRRLLFVDDDPNVLQGLRRSMRRMRHDWALHFAESGPVALAMIEEEPFDIVVSDMMMPQMDGAELLSEVKRRDPTTMRIILSGHSDREMILRSVGCSHQYLCKPCDPDVLRSTIERANHLREALGSEAIQSLVSEMDSLPSLPVIYQRVVTELRKPNASLEEVGAIIELDVGMSAKILQIVNSPYFGLRRSIGSVSRAVVHLGLETVTALVLGSSAFSLYEATSPVFSLEAVWRHSLQTANCARAIAKVAGFDKQSIDSAFLAGVLHDVGKAILAAEAPERFDEAIRLSRDRGISSCDAERSTLGATHAEIGAYVIATWGLPDSIIEAIAYHNEPQRSRHRVLGELAVVHVADTIAYESSTGSLSPLDSTIDEEFLDQIGVSAELDSWCEAGRTVLAEAELHV